MLGLKVNNENISGQKKNRNKFVKQKRLLDIKLVL